MMTTDYGKNIEGLSNLIGNTPLLAIELLYKGEKRVIYAKAENLNMTGSIKDRMAFHILKEAYKRGSLAPGHCIIEATSGNTGISISAIARALKHRVTIYMPDWMSAERINIIKSFGAEIILVSRKEGGFLGSISKAEEQAEKEENSFLPRQFSNEDNVQAHFTTTGPEIWTQLHYRGLIPAAFIAGVGTGGTIMGAGKYLRQMNPEIYLHPLEPSNSPTLSTGHKVGKHRIQGISDEFIPSIVKLNELDKVIAIDDGDAIIMSQKLAFLGIGVGISSGANFLGALKIQNEIGANKVVVTIFSDDNKKYLSTDLMKEEPAEKDFLAPEVELLSFRSIKRACHTCCDPNDCAEANFSDPDNQFDLPCCPRRDNK